METVGRARSVNFPSWHEAGRSWMLVSVARLIGWARGRRSVSCPAMQGADSTLEAHTKSCDAGTGPVRNAHVEDFAGMPMSKHVQECVKIVGFPVEACGCRPTTWLSTVPCTVLRIVEAPRLQFRTRLRGW